MTTTATTPPPIVLPSSRRLPSLRTSILALVALGAGMVLILGGLVIMEIRNNERARLEANLLGQARDLALLVDREFAEAITGLQALSGSHALATADLANFEIELRAFSSRFDDTVVKLIDVGGRQIINTVRLPQPDDLAAQRPPEAMRALATGVPQIGPARPGEFSNDTILPVAVPVFLGHDSWPSYVLALELPRRRIARLLANAQLPQPGWIALVADSAKLGVARMVDGVETPILPRSAAMALATRDANEGVARDIPSRDGSRATFGFARAPASGYLVAIGLPAGALSGPLFSVLLRAGLLLVLALLISGAIALRLAARIIGAVRALLAAPGNPDQHYRFAEVRAVAETMALTAAARARAEAAVRALFEASPVGIGRTHVDGRVLDANDALLDMLGATRAELAAGRLRWDVLTAPEWRLRDEEALAELKSRGMFRPFEKDWILPGGRRLPVLVAGAMIDRRAGESAGLYIDLSRLREVEAARLRLATVAEQERSRLVALFDALPVGVAIVDETGRVLLANPAYPQRQPGRADFATDAGVTHWFGLAADGSRLARQDFPGPRALRGETVLPGIDFLHTDPEGRQRWVRIAATPVPTAAGEPRQALVVLQDIDAEKRLADDRGRLNDLLEARVLSEVAAREAAQVQLAQAQRLQALGQLAGGIAHDFNNVLQAVQSASALLERRIADPALHRLTRLMLDATERGGSITRRLLAFARQGDLRAEPIDAAALLADMAEMLTRTLGDAVSCTAETAPGLPLLLADKGQLEAALVNLATNARDAMPGGGGVHLQAAREQVAAGVAHRAGLAAGDYVRLSVRDSGQGMDSATLARVTEPFFTTKPIGQGTGLGLAMVKGFSEQSGGGMAIDSSAGGGTVVTIWLPLAPEGPARNGQGEEPVRFDPAAPPRILLVDDNPQVLAGVGALIEEAGGHVLAFAHAAEALAALEQGLQVDALVSDVSMPVMDGMALARAARQLLPELPVMLITGYAGVVGMEQLPQLGPRCVLLRKPVQAQLLLRRLAALLSPAPCRA